MNSEITQAESYICVCTRGICFEGGFEKGGGTVGSILELADERSHKNLNL